MNATPNPTLPVTEFIVVLLTMLDRLIFFLLSIHS